MSTVLRWSYVSKITDFVDKWENANKTIRLGVIKAPPVPDLHDLYADINMINVVIPNLYNDRMSFPICIMTEWQSWCQ